MRPAALLVLAALAAAPAGAESLAAQVNEAIERGVARLRGWQQRDGSFQSRYAEHYPPGPTALAVYALAKSQVDPDDAAIADAVAFLRKTPYRKTYSAATIILALDALRRPEHAAWIRSIAKWIEKNADKRDRQWGYVNPASYEHNDTCLSNTQFAVLGLWRAEGHGYKARRQTWRDLVRRVPDLCGKNGAFRYHPAYPEMASMTAAGITVLTLAIERLPKGERKRRYVRVAQDAIEEGWGYVERTFTVEKNPQGPEGAEDRGFLYYHLYGIERVAALTGRWKISGHDWYAEGARLLLAKQHADGGWGNLADTCFALLFLRKATFTSVGRAGGPDEQGREPFAFETRRPARTVPFVRRWLVLGALADADGARLRRPFLGEDAPDFGPRAGDRAEGRPWTPHRQLRAFFDLAAATGGREKTLSCALTYLHVKRDTEVVFWSDHDDGAVVLLDGRELRRDVGPQAAAVDGWSVRTTLARGVRRLLFKVRAEGGPGGLYCRIAGPHGGPAPAVMPSLSPDRREEEANARAHPELFPPARLLRRLPLDAAHRLTFEERADAARLAYAWNDPDSPVWFGEITEKTAGRAPAPGAQGVVRLHPWADYRGARAYWKTRVPDTSKSLELRVCPEVKGMKGKADVRLRVGICDGARLHWPADEVVAGSAWRVVSVPVGAFAGKTVLVVVEAARAGEWNNEYLFLDSIGFR